MHFDSIYFIIRQWRLNICFGSSSDLQKRRKKMSNNSERSAVKNGTGTDTVVSEASFDHRFLVTSSDVRIHYVLERPSPNVVNKNQTIVLVHGWPDLWFGWRYLIKPLAAAGYTVIAPDLRGFGQSDAPKEVELYSWKYICRDLADILSHHSVQSAIFVGHDWGGMVVWRMALHHPERVSAVASLLTPYTPPAAEYVPIDKLVKVVPQFLYQAYFNDGDRANRELDNNVERAFKIVYRKHDELTPGAWMKDGTLLGNADPEPSKLLTPEELQYYVSQYKNRGFKSGLNLYRTREFVWKEEQHLVSNPVIRQPCLMVTAGKDPVLQASMSSKMEKVVPNLKRAHIENSGHWIQIEHRDKIQQIIIEWLNSLSTPSKL
eukprot:TRINITY_DN601_c0_g1_i1.p1 TRINITY_DN601_c0_g1~~TRINITY_DN601_c0_g1_i1.p1  ORF type:complete len:376 (+),score=60.83 TRINITY_DN601_c0_g1_i1:40-1167(+)